MALTIFSIVITSTANMLEEFSVVLNCTFQNMYHRKILKIVTMRTLHIIGVKLKNIKLGFETSMINGCKLITNLRFLFSLLDIFLFLYILIYNKD